MAFNYDQLQQLGGGVPAVDPAAQLAAFGGGAPQGGGMPNPAQNTGVAGNLGSGGFDYMAPAPGAPAPTYTPDQFSSWYQQQFGNPIDQGLLGQIGAAVGPAGENGQYSQAQFDQGKQLAQQQQQNAKPFFPEFKPPEYQAGPAYQAPEKFVAPTMEQAQADPGYQFALNQGMNALQNAQAAKGLARTGASLKALMDYGQQAATQQYDKVYDRAASQYGQNYQMGRDAWTLNDAQRRDARDFGYRGASDAFNANFRGRELQFEDLFRRWAQNTNIQTQLALAD
mgnify:CR=1 FL=1